MGSAAFGLAALLGALAAGAQRGTAVDPFPAKRALALELGAVQVVSPEESASLPRADVVIETVGKAAVLAQTYGAARRGGRIVTVGLPRWQDADGQLYGFGDPVPRYSALIRVASRPLPVERLLSSISPLADLKGLLDKLAADEAIRQVVLPQKVSLSARRILIVTCRS